MNIFLECQDTQENTYQMMNAVSKTIIVDQMMNSVEIRKLKKQQNFRGKAIRGIFESGKTIALIIVLCRPKMCILKPIQFRDKISHMFIYLF